MDKSQLPKMIKKLHLYLLLLCSLVGLGGYAQTFPIRITTQLTQPSPIYLSNYADAKTVNSPIKIQLVLNDLTISNRQVKLKIYFQGNGIAFSTNDFVVGAKPLYLEGGFPLQLTNVDLAPYFEYQNLLGLTPNQYAQPLPEGVYNIYVEVYDFATNRKLSSKTGSTTIIFQNEPPFLNLPLNNASIMQQNIQNIIFGWTPRSINVSNVEYEFSLVEIWDKYTPVQNAFAYSPPLYTTTTRTTSLQYGINEPQLIPGKKYAWRVKAKALLGAEEIGVFKNNGYSEIYSFTYEVFCTAPLAINTEGISENQAKVTWTGSIDNFDYQVKYREKNAGSEWYDLVTPRETVTISNLKPNTTYEYTVGASCDVGKYIHSTVKEFKTLVRDEIAFQGCGIKPDPADLANKNPLPQLFPNDVIAAGDFPIVVLHATGSNGTFSGDGYVTLPFLEKFRKLIDAADALGGDKVNIGQFSRIRITFNNIGLNTDFKLISGEIIAAYDPNWGGILDGDKLVDDIADTVEEYDPIMESIFGPKPKPEENAEIPDEEDEITNDNPKPTITSPIEYTPIEIVEVNEPDPVPPPIENETTAEKNDPKEQSSPATGEVTEKGYYIEYKGQKYYNGGKIKIPYRRNMSETFEMKTVPTDAKVSYSIFEPGQQKMVRTYESTTSKSTLPIEDSKFAVNLLKQDLQSEATSIEGNPKVKVEVEKIVEKFTQNKLTATDMSDPDNKKRYAIAPQTLYYISKSSKRKEFKNTKFEVILSQTDLNKIPKDYIKWKINGTDNAYLNGKTNFKIDVNDSIPNATFTNIAGSPNTTSKDVKIKWVERNIKSINITDKLGPLLTIFDEINYWSKEAKVLGLPCSISVLNNLKPLISKRQLSIASQTSNEEDESSRLYNEVSQFDLSASGAEMLKLECGKELKVTIPFTSKEIDIASAKFEVVAGLQGALSVVRQKQIETNKVNYKKSNISLVGYITPSLSASLLGVKGDVSLTAGVKFVYPFEGNNSQIGMVFYSDDCIGKISVSKDVSVFVTKDFSYELFRLDTATEKTVGTIDLKNILN
jgi:hypothetical protein